MHELIGIRCPKHCGDFTDDLHGGPCQNCRDRMRDEEHEDPDEDQEP